jgi:hypothetical protein
VSDDDNMESEDEEFAFEHEEIEPIMFQAETKSVRALMLEVEDEELDIAPSWQRGDVWNEPKKRNLIKSLLVGIPLPSLIVFNEKNSKSSILDGKQRMTAISQFMNGAFTLKSFKEDKQLDGFKLKECQDKAFIQLPDAAQRKIRQTLIPVTNLKNLDSDQVYVIFELYNTSGTNLNAAEIRNAVYRDHPIHQLVYELGADGVSHYSEILPKKLENEIKLFTEGVRNYVYNFKPKDQNRLNAVDFIERYLGYSSCSHPPGVKFKATSTKDAIRLFYKFSAENYTVEGLCNELIQVLELAADLFLGLNNIGLTKDNKFNGLYATTTMVTSKLISKAIEESILDKKKAREIIESLDKIITPPENQNSGTIWKFQSQWVTGIFNEFSSGNQKKIEAALPKLIKASRKVMEK